MNFSDMFKIIGTAYCTLFQQDVELIHSYYDCDGRPLFYVKNEECTDGYYVARFEQLRNVKLLEPNLS